jgi:asparagine synthase (glutamine-hydrolysing)
MCGIGGYINLKAKADESVIKQMTDSIAHRGPDGFGHKIFENAAIGHRRLSIIDLASGAQPMSNVNETLWITFNGEIYNYLELKTELKKLDVVFKTNSDTEVIIYAYEKWGANCVNKLRGMFAFAILDTTKKEIFIARDHFGIKPVYIYTDKNSIAFGSEIQQFKFIPGFDSSINNIALDNFLWLQYIPAPLTIFNSVQKLKPAHHITISLNGKISEQKQYWDISYSKKQVKTKEEWLEATNDVIKKSVEAHLLSDVPFGAFLSGGIDSTLVVKYMSEILPKKVKTFSIGFEEEAYNELKYSELAAKEFNTEHYTQIVKPNALDLLPKLVKHYGEPFGDSSALPTYYVCELAKKHVTMVLSGDGGDECFAGYGSYLHWMKYMPVNHRSGLKKTLYPHLEKILPARYPKKDTLNYWLGHIEYLDNNWRSKLWKDEFRAAQKNKPEGFESFFDHTKKYSMANKVQYMDAKTYMPYDILTKVDIASMCHSLEVRTPLIDKEVWEFAATIPEEFNINKDGKNNWEGKLLLKQLLAKHFPHEFIYRKKQGFAIPLEKWFSNEGQLREKLNDSVLAKNSNISSFFDHNAINELVHSKNTGGMWLMLFLEEWLSQFKN